MEVYQAFKWSGHIKSKRLKFIIYGYFRTSHLSEANSSSLGSSSRSDRSKNESNKSCESKEKKDPFSSSFSLNRSSINEKAESATSLFLDIDVELETSHSNFLAVQNEHFGSNQSINKTCSDEISRLSRDTPSMTQAYSVSRGPADPDGSAGAPLVTKNFESTELIQTSRSSKARQKKFHRHFKQVDIEEKVLNYYSCALVGDILLQGHLYITENFFAFYSNVFGYVTKLLIPTADVLKISKEKTAKIIPNAVGISTEDEKHVFGSLLSRDSTYKFMCEVWKAANSSIPVVNITPPPIMKNKTPSDEDSSVSSGNEEPSSENFPQILPSLKRRSILMSSVEAKNSRQPWRSFKVTNMLIISVILLVLLFTSAGYLVYRIAIIQNHFDDLTPLLRGSEKYEDILKWQSALHSTSAKNIYEFLNNNINQIIKVRLSLEALSVLIMPSNNNNNNNEKSNQRSKWGSPKVQGNNEGATAEDNSNHSNQ